MNRRTFVGALLAVPAVNWAATVLAKSLQFQNNILRPDGQFPGNNPPSAPQVRPPEIPPPPEINPHAILVENQKNMTKDADRLFALATKLRDQIHKINSADILSLDMIHTTEEIEKLAKHIRSLERG